MQKAAPALDFRSGVEYHLALAARVLPLFAFRVEAVEEDPLGEVMTKGRLACVVANPGQGALVNGAEPTGRGELDACGVERICGVRPLHQPVERFGLEGGLRQHADSDSILFQKLCVVGCRVGTVDDRFKGIEKCAEDVPSALVRVRKCVRAGRLLVVNTGSDVDVAKGREDLLWVRFHDVRRDVGDERLEFVHDAKALLRAQLRVHRQVLRADRVFQALA